MATFLFSRVTILALFTFVAPYMDLAQDTQSPFLNSHFTHTRPFQYLKPWQSYVNSSGTLHFKSLSTGKSGIANVKYNLFHSRGKRQLGGGRKKIANRLGKRNTLRPVYSLTWPFVRNPNFIGSTLLPNNMANCITSDALSGICLASRACRRYGGQAKGSCSIGVVCCVTTISDCYGRVATLNNTYFQSPSKDLSSSACNLIVKLDSHLAEQQGQAVCQVRLDLISFTLAQPAATGQCLADSFQTSGALNVAPVICGDNDNQHLYLHVTPSNLAPSELRLNFKFGATSITTRSWNIKISFIPCASSFKAPYGCLQYFTTAFGTIKSFNWKDATPTMRQLASQDYNICFRTEYVNNKRATKMCLTECKVSNAGNAFSVSGNAATSQSLTCTKNYLGFVGGYTIQSFTFEGKDYKDPSSDRYCGGNFHPFAGLTSKMSVCSTTRPFQVSYKTASTSEDVTFKNMGFCLNFQQLPL